MSHIKVTFGACSKASERHPNQDAHYAAPDILVVADGVGYYDGAATASRLAITGSINAVRRLNRDPGVMPEDLAFEVMQAANGELRDAKNRRQLHPNAAATLAAVIFRPTGEGLLVWAGDSYVDHIDGNRTTTLTSRHTKVGELTEMVDGDSKFGYSARTIAPPAKKERLVVATDGTDWTVGNYHRLDGSFDREGLDRDYRRAVSLSPQEAAEELVRLAAPDFLWTDDTTVIVADVYPRL